MEAAQEFLILLTVQKNNRKLALASGLIEAAEIGLKLRVPETRAEGLFSVLACYTVFVI